VPRSTPYSLRRPLVALLAFALLVAMAAVSQPSPASAGDPASGGARMAPSKGSWYTRWHRGWSASGTSRNGSGS
jgi:hypothetical protein